MLEFQIADAGRLQQRLRAFVQTQEKAARDALVAVADEIVRDARGRVLENREAPPSVPSPLASSLERRVGPEQVVIGTDVTYAPFVELGTHRQAAEPFLQPAFDDAVARLRQSSRRAGGGS